MKKITFLLIILGCLLFCGCAATADIEYGIDSDNTAYTRLRVDVNGGELSYSDKERVKSALRDVAKHYRDTLGFECDFGYFTQNDNNAYIILTKTVPAESFEEAFENLKQMLCDDALSVFSEVSCELSDTRIEYAYRINGRVDLHRALENTYNSGIAKGVADHVKEQLETCSLSVTLSMPYNTKLYRLSLDEPTEICYEGKEFCIFDSPSPPLMVETLYRYLKIILFALGVFSVISFVGIMMGIVMIKKGKKTPEPASTVSGVIQFPQNGEDPDVKEDQNTL